jgi:RNA polymerase sigma-70 factor (family 1)
MELRSPDGDRALVERIRSGDAAAYEHLLREHWAPLVRFARRMLPGADDPQDVVQDVFVRLWRRREALKTDGSVRALLFTMTRNAALDEIRRQGRRDRAAAAQDPRRSTPLPSQDLAADELAAAAREAVAALPPKRQSVFRLVREEGLSYAEVAEVMNVSPQTVANQMSLAMADLRKALRNHLPEEIAP